LQRIVAIPELRTLFGVIASQVRPAGATSVRLTVPRKPFTEPIMILELADERTFEVSEERTVMVKSTKLKITVAECDRKLLVPVIVRA
jgi:hypothetical protein